MPSRVIPGLRYRNAHAAIAWLELVFGFKRKAVYDGPNGTVAHAELTLGDGMLMLGSVRDTADEMRQPDEVRMAVTQAPYVIVDDARAVFAKAVTAGGSPLGEPVEMSYGGWGCSFRDPEGHVWHVGEYDPWSLAV